ncbi:MAG: ATP-binding protein [Bacteroidales bacterium]|nr:ATP-binding protein [Bacteroidales bacterium]
MRKLTICNIGPLKEVELNLKRVNVVIGPQSVGKSCILKIACFCAWLEKQIELSQSKKVTDDINFWEECLIEFHKLEGFIKDGCGAKFSYNTSTMNFSYDFDNNDFKFNWKSNGRWKYERTRISYIPAERNIVGAIPNLLDVDLPENNIKNFIIDWNKSRQNYDFKEQLNILNLGVHYYYDESKGKDMLNIGTDNPLSFSDSSSGLQSPIPMWVYLDYLFEKQYTSHKVSSSISTTTGNDFILQNIYSTKYKRGVQQKVEKGEACYEKIGNVILAFESQESANSCRKLFETYTKNSRSDIYLEEPEQNLFPQTQVELVYDLLKKSIVRGDSIFIATHSPYILYALNNCMLGYLVKDKVSKDLSDKSDSWIDPKEVSVWELRDGKLSSEIDIKTSTLQDKDGLIRGNYFDRIMHNIMADFTNYSVYYE